MRYVVVVLLLGLLLTGCGKDDKAHYCFQADSTGCTQVPTDAKKADFCAAGATFSDVQGFANGVKAANDLAAVGTPSDIKASARTGFLELVERMFDSQNGPDFRERTQNLSADASKHLLDLDTYISATC